MNATKNSQARLPGSNARRIINSMKKRVYDSTFMYPLVIANGYDCTIEDVDGNRFLDFTSNIGACPLGYSHPDIIEVLSEYSTNGTHKIAGQDFYCKEHADLAEKISSIIPHGFKTFFINSGAEAVENAIKIAYRKWVLCLEFHVWEDSMEERWVLSALLPVDLFTSTTFQNFPLRE